MGSTVKKFGYGVSIILVLAATGACHSTKPAVHAEGTPAARVKLASVQSGSIRETSDLIGRSESRRSVTLQPQISGRVSQIFVQPGTAITKGTALIQVDPDRQQTQVISFRAAAAAAQADLDNARASLIPLEADRRAKSSDASLQQQQYDRYSLLYQQGAVSRDVLDQRRNSLETAKAELDAAIARIQVQRSVITNKGKLLQQAQANVSGQQVELQYYQIKAPFTGVVGNIPVKVGDYVNPSTQLVTITQNQPLEVNISVPSERASNLRLGMMVQLINQQGRLIGSSTVFFISPTVNQQTESILIKTLFENRDGRLRADQQATARIIWDERPGVLVPTTAVSRLGGQNFIFVAQSQPNTQLVARQKPIKLGDIEGNQYQVIEGLKPGERIVVSGVQQLSDGAVIAPDS